MNDGPKIVQDRYNLRSIEYQTTHIKVPRLTSRQIAHKLTHYQNIDQALFVIPSPIFLDNVLLLEALLPPSSHILCVEINQHLMSFSLAHAEQKALKSKRITYIRSDSSQAINNTVETLGIWKFRRCHMFILRRLSPSEKGTYDLIFNALQQSVHRFWQNKLTLVRMGSMWIKNIFKNLALCSNSSPITSLHLSKPVCVIGAGESLEKSIPTLSFFRKQLFLISVDTALPILIQSGLRPDLVVILESQSINLKDFIGHNSYTIPAVFDLSSHPGFRSVFKGTSYYFLSHFADCSLLTDMGHCFPELLFIPSLGSVGVTAVYLASLITDFPVLITGLDFSYIPGKPHARGAPSQLLSLAASSRLQPLGYYENAIERSLFKITDNNSMERFTDPVLQSYVEPLKSIIGHQKRFFDIGGYGLATGAAPLRSHDEIEKVLSSPIMYEKEPAASREEEASGTISHDRIQQFYRNQASILAEIIDLGKSMITGSCKPGTLVKLQKMVETHDYILAHFPETPPFPYEDSQFMKRIVVSAGYYHSVIKRVQTG